MVAAVEEGCLGPGKGHGVVGGDDDQGLVGPARFLQCVEQTAHAKVEAGDRLIVLGEVGSHVGYIGQIGRHHHVVGTVLSFRHIRVGTLIAKTSTCAVGIGKPHVHVERLVGISGPKVARGAGQFDAISGIDFRLKVKRVHAGRFYVLFADAGGGVAMFLEAGERRGNMGVRGEAVDAVAVTVLAVGVAVVSREDAGAADRARRAGAEGLLEDHALAGKRVDAGRVDDAIAVALGNAAPVVGDEE